MIAATRSDRDLRPGGRWSTPTLLDEVTGLAALERALVHLLAGNVPKVGDLDQKLALAAGLEDGMVRAGALRQHALTLLERDGDALVVTPGFVEPLRRLDGAGTSPGLTAIVFDEVRPFLRDRYRDLATRLDPLLDTRLLATVTAAIEALSSSTSAIGTPLPTGSTARPDGAGPSGSSVLDPTGSPPAPGSAIGSALGSAWTTVGRDEDRVALDAVLWGPVDRVPQPARPLDRARPPVGTRAHYRKGSRLTRDDLAGELNDNVMAELCALELLCRCSYEHPELPWASHLAMARHAADEARHAAIFRRLLVANGIDERELTQHGANYEYGYEFPECEPGSPRELVWRLLILCTVLEALAIDKLPVEIGGRDFVGQTEFARALDYIASDELFHTENGLRLTRGLCAELGLDPILERERVHGRFFGRQRDVRLAYLEEDPERAALEIAILEAPDPDGVPYVSRTEVELRRRASFTLAECEQVERWGYNPVRHELLDAPAD